MLMLPREGGWQVQDLTGYVFISYEVHKSPTAAKSQFFESWSHAQIKN